MIKILVTTIEYITWQLHVNIKNKIRTNEKL